MSKILFLMKVHCIKKWIEIPTHLFHSYNTNQTWRNFSTSTMVIWQETEKIHICLKLFYADSLCVLYMSIHFSSSLVFLFINGSGISMDFFLQAYFYSYFSSQICQWMYWFCPFFHLLYSNNDNFSCAFLFFFFFVI